MGKLRTFGIARYSQAHVTSMLVKNPQESAEPLLYSRQFLLSTDARHALPNHQGIMLAWRYHLSVHKDLELTHLKKEIKSLTLLGFMLDPERPEVTNEQILLSLIEDFIQCRDLFLLTETLGGRWVLIAHDGSETMVMHDATGQRQVHFSYDPGSGGLMCASEPGIMAEQLGLSMDSEAVDFIRSRTTDDYEIYWMPGDTSLFTGIKALLPNHALFLSTGICERFFSQVSPMLTDHASILAECLRLIRGQFDSARGRFPLAIPITAGWDSRLMLALNQDYAADLYAFTLVYPHLPMRSRDVVVPARLLAKLGIAHHVIPYPKQQDAEFKKIFRRNNVSANEAYCGDIQALHDHYPSERVCVTGDAAEIVKCYYERSRPESAPITARELAEFSRLGSHPFVIRAFERWLESVECPSIDLLDLFCWEQMTGRWQAKIRSEYDMVQESFSPLNNRRLLRIMLEIDPQMRRAPDFKLFAELIEALWPDVLSEPINPPEFISNKRRLLNTLKNTGIFRLIPKSVIGQLKSLLH
jgi:hypothetical protein